MRHKSKLSAIAITSFLLSLTTAAQQEKLIVYFDFDKASITAESAARLDSLIQAGGLNQVELKGHCDKIGPDVYNDKLSVKRAVAVKNYLSKKGFSNSIIGSTEGFGEHQPVNQNTDDAERAYNRRVEIWIQRGTASATSKTETRTLTQQIKDTTATKTGSNIVLQNMNFEGGRHVLLSQSIPVLQELLQIMKDNPKLIIEIHGHICCTLDPDGLDHDLGTVDLSVQRAKAIYTYLVDNGIDASRLSYRGYGSTRKIYAFEQSEFERTQNRRVEIKIVKR